MKKFVVLALLMFISVSFSCSSDSSDILDPELTKVETLNVIYDAWGNKLQVDNEKWVQSWYLYPDYGSIFSNDISITHTVHEKRLTFNSTKINIIDIIPLNFISDNFTYVELYDNTKRIIYEELAEHMSQTQYFKFKVEYKRT